MQTAKETGSKVIQATDRVFLFIQPEQMASMHSCLVPCASWHIRRLFSSSGRRMEPSPLWPMQWCMAVSVYSQLCAACDGWRWREESPGCAADIKISSRDAVERGEGSQCHPPQSSLSFTHALATHSLFLYISHPVIHLSFVNMSLCYTHHCPTHLLLAGIIEFFLDK